MVNDEDLLNRVYQAMAPKKRAQQEGVFIPDRVGPMNAGAVQDIEPLPYDEDDPEPPYPGVTPQSPRELTPRDKYAIDADRAREKRDPYEDRGLINYPIQDIRDALIGQRTKDKELELDAMKGLEGEEYPGKEHILKYFKHLKGLDPAMDDFEFVRQMRNRLNIQAAPKLYDDIAQDEAFRQENPGRHGIRSLDRPAKGDPFSSPFAYPQQSGRGRRATVYEE